MIQQNYGKRLHKKRFNPFCCSVWLLAVLFFVSCNGLPSEENNNDKPSITEVWVTQRVDISIDGLDGNHYSYSFMDKEHFDNRAYEDNYGYWSDYSKVFSPYAYIIFENNRILSLATSQEYEDYQKDPSIIFPLPRREVEYLKIEGNKLYINVKYHTKYDLGDELAYYIKSNDKTSIVLEVYGDAITGYYQDLIPQGAWPVLTHADTHYHYTAFYKKIHID